MSMRTAIGRMAAIALLAAGLCLPTACNKETKPTAGGATPAATTPAGGAAAPASSGQTAEVPAANVPAKPVALPAGIEAEDANMLGYIRVHDTAKAIDRLAVWMQTVSPMMSAQMLHQQLAQAGIDTSELRAGENITVFLWKGDNPMGGPKIAMLLPTSTDSKLAQQAKVKFAPETQVAQLGQDVLLAENGESLSLAQAVSKNLTEINAAPMKTDLQIYLNTDALVSTYGAMVRNQLAMLQTLSAQAPPDQQAQAAASMRLLQGGTTGALDYLGTLKSATINLTMDPDAAEVSAVIRPKDPSLYDDQPANGPNLVKYVAGNHMMEFQTRLTDLQPILNGKEATLNSVLGPGMQSTVDALMSTLKQIAEQGPVDAGASLDVVPGSGVRALVVTQTGDAQKTAEVRRQYLTMLQSNPGSTLFDVTVKEKARTVLGQPVDQVIATLKTPASLSPQQAQQLQAIWGSKPITIEFMQLEKFNLLSVGEPIDALAQRVKDDKASGQMVAEQVFEPGANVYFDMDIAANVAAALKAQNPQAPAPQAGKPLSVAAYCQQGVAFLRMKLPKEMIGQIAMLDIAMGSTPMPGMQPGGAGMTPMQ